MNEAPSEVPCTYHPQTLTSLRCSRCEKPICSKDAVRTPTGYRCPDCIRGQQKAFDTSRGSDYLIAVVIAAPLSFLGSWLIPNLGFFTILLAPIAGGIIGEAIRRAIQRRRSKRLFRVAAAAAALGSAPLLITNGLTSLLFLSSGGFGLLWSVLLQGLYTVLVTSSVYYSLSGIHLRA